MNNQYVTPLARLREFGSARHRWLNVTRSLLQPNLVLAFKYDLKGFLILCNPPVNTDGVSGKFSQVTETREPVLEHNQRQRCIGVTATDIQIAVVLLGAIVRTSCRSVRSALAIPMLNTGLDISRVQVFLTYIGHPIPRQVSGTPPNATRRIRIT